MPVRKIPIGTRSVTGQHARTGARYESSLERDFYELMTFDPEVQDIDWQPVTIKYRDEQGNPRRYTPDALITFKNNEASANFRCPLLCEVKYRADFKRNFIALRRQFRAACSFAEERGWRFKVFTDETIRTPTFSNLHFLSGYRDRQPSAADINLLLEFLRHARTSTPAALLTMVSTDNSDAASLIPTLWWLVWHRRIIVELSAPLTMHSTIRAAICP